MEKQNICFCSVLPKVNPQWITPRIHCESMAGKLVPPSIQETLPLFETESDHLCGTKESEVCVDSLPQRDEVVPTPGPSPLRLCHSVPHELQLVGSKVDGQLGDQTKVGQVHRFAQLQHCSIKE